MDKNEDVAIDDSRVAVEDTSLFRAGDLVLLWQHGGAVTGEETDDDDSVLLGESDGLGRYELGRVIAVDQEFIDFAWPIGVAFAARHSQAVRVPEYSRLTVASGGSMAARERVCREQS